MPIVVKQSGATYRLISLRNCALLRSLHQLNVPTERHWFWTITARAADAMGQGLRDKLRGGDGGFQIKVANLLGSGEESVSLHRLIELVEPHVVRIETPNGYGTGFLAFYNRTSGNTRFGYETAGLQIRGF